MTTPFIAMAGLAEAEFALELLLAWSGLILTGIFVLGAWIKRSWILFCVALGLMVFLTLYFEPWRILMPVPKDFAYELGDPDYVYWRARFQFLGVVWAGALISLAISTPFFRRISKRPREVVGVPQLRHP